jgi:hypothetical protein
VSLLSFLPNLCETIQASRIGTDLRESIFMFPLIETSHVIGLSVSVGLILMTDLRLIGKVMRGEPASDIMNQLRPWMVAGFISMFLSGSLLFWAEAAKCYRSPTFRAKMVFLFLAGVNAFFFETTIGRKVASWDQVDPPTRAKVAGWTSLVCWTGVIIFGRWTAYGLS